MVASSSAIRKLVASGDVDIAAHLLGRPFSIKETVISGMKRGRLLGFPTANLAVPKDLISPKAGVYTGMVKNRQQNLLYCCKYRIASDLWRY